MQAVYVGAMVDINAQTFARMDDGGYTLINLTGSYALTDNWQLFGRLDNLTNKNYQNPNGFQQMGFGAYGGVRLTF
jgi:vitamin B12 transporter